MARTSSAVPIAVRLALFLSVVIAYAALLATVSAEEAAAEQPSVEKAETIEQPEQPAVEELPDDATLLKMKVRELKGILAKKGMDAECVACTSKREFVERIHETADWPNVEPKKPDPSDSDTPSMEELNAMFNKGPDEEKLEELKKKLREAGIDTSQLVTGGNFDPEAFAKKYKKWDGAGAPGSDAGAKEDSHTDL